MFVFVNAGPGSKALKRLETPLTTILSSIEFKIQVMKMKSSRFMTYWTKIRLLDDSLIDISDEVQLSELSQLMFDLGTAEERSKNTERGVSMYISKGAVKRSRPAHREHLARRELW